MKYTVYCPACGKKHSLAFGERKECTCNIFIELMDGDKHGEVDERHIIKAVSYSYSDLEEAEDE